MHSYGIVHRDIKLENIMMSDTTEESVPKMADFGLSKMIGPNEQAKEPFGTLGYVAPEILKKQPYSKAVDLWSFGCLVYSMLAKELPFDSKDDDEIRRMTMKDPVKFEKPCWSNYGSTVKNLLTRLLHKDPDMRIAIEEVLEHSWFKKIDEQS